MKGARLMQQKCKYSPESAVSSPLSTNVKKAMAGVLTTNASNG